MNESTDPNGVLVIECSWNEFITDVRERTNGAGRPYIFRGQASPRWPLKAPLARALDAAPGLSREWKAFLERERLKLFVGRAAPFIGPDARFYEENDWWALGRHFGLATPLLDWTASPFVAAFFAFNEFAREQDPLFRMGLPQSVAPRDVGTYVGRVAVWALDPQIASGRDFEIIEPTAYTNTRLHAQRGMFTLLRNVNFTDLIQFFANSGSSNPLTRWEIDGASTPEALTDLLHMNITPSVLFPDLSGAAEAANSEEMWRTALNMDRVRKAVAVSTQMPPFTAYGVGAPPDTEVKITSGGREVTTVFTDRSGRWAAVIATDLKIGDQIEFAIRGRVQATEIFSPGGAPRDRRRGVDLSGGGAQ